MATAYIKRGDQTPALLITLTDAGTPVDLSAANGIRLIVRDGPDSGNPAIIDAALLGRPTNGALTYQWAPQDTARAGRFKAEVEVTWSGGVRQTFPVSDYAEIVIVPDLD